MAAGRDRQRQAALGRESRSVGAEQAERARAIGQRHVSVVRALSGSKLENGFVEVRFKSISGREDQAGGAMWRWKDGDNYYGAGANARENTVSLSPTTNGRRTPTKSVDAPVPKNVRPPLRVDFPGRRIK